ncbi:MAG: aquaporin [Calditrichaeota bacterium]|nr:aquaporin [Calditrichota bacterium]MCB9368011.1 aquaporin [Calditrichota bacterium]
MNFKALFAEFIGTFALVFVTVGAIVSDHLTNGAVGLTGIALASGLTIAAMASATLAISGGHLNPAVSFGMFIVGRMKVKDFVGYSVVQCLGAVAASSLLMSAISPLDLDAVNYGITAVGESATPYMALITEIVLTFILMVVIFGTVVDKRSVNMSALFVGIAVTMNILMGGPISGAAMNPARWLGPALVSGDYLNAWIYWVGPIAGGALGVVVYTTFLQEE